MPDSLPTAPLGVVLLVDDDEAVRGYCQMVLELNGWQVLTADSGPAALEVATRHGKTIQTLVTDVVMPEMNGRELADALWLSNPGLKVLFLSGFHADEVLQAGVEAEELHFLGKPFTPAMFLEKLQRLHNDASA